MKNELLNKKLKICQKLPRNCSSMFLSLVFAQLSPFWRYGSCRGLIIYGPPCITTNQSSLFRLRVWLSANQGPAFASNNTSKLESRHDIIDEFGERGFGVFLSIFPGLKQKGCVRTMDYLLRSTNADHILSSSVCI